MQLNQTINALIKCVCEIGSVSHLHLTVSLVMILGYLQLCFLWDKRQFEQMFQAGATLLFFFFFPVWRDPVMNEWEEKSENFTKHHLQRWHVKMIPGEGCDPLAPVVSTPHATDEWRYRAQKDGGMLASIYYFLYSEVCTRARMTVCQGKCRGTTFKCTSQKKNMTFA